MQTHAVDPTNLLHAQHKLELPWITEKIRRLIGYHAEVLNFGNNEDYLPVAISQAGHRVISINPTPFPKESFDVVMAMDILAQVSDPPQVLDEAWRVLRPGGLLFYSVLNLHPLARADGIKMIPAKAMQSWLYECGMESVEMCGMRPVLLQKALLDLFKTGQVNDGFQYRFSRSVTIGYIGCAKKMRFVWRGN